jgi:hypothetical protein
MGLFMSFQFAFGGFANAFLLAPLTKLMGGSVQAVVKRCILCMGISYLIQAWLFASPSSSVSLGFVSVPKPVPFVAIAMVLATFQYSLGTSITAETTSLVDESMHGTLMGIEHSLFALANIVGPAAGTYLYSVVGLSGLSGTCGGLFIFVLFVFYCLHAPIVKQKAS